jgi:hypothetical protein
MNASFRTRIGECVEQLIRLNTGDRIMSFKIPTSLVMMLVPECRMEEDLEWVLKLMSVSE